MDEERDGEREVWVLHIVTVRDMLRLRGRNKVLLRATALLLLPRPFCFAFLFDLLPLFSAHHTLLTSPSPTILISVKLIKDREYTVALVLESIRRSWSLTDVNESFWSMLSRK